MDYSFEIKNSKQERVAYQTITSTTKAKAINAIQQYMLRNPQVVGTGHTCTLTSFDWNKGNRLVGVFSLK